MIVDDTKKVFIDILNKKYPEHYFDLNIGMNGLFIYGPNDDGVYKFCSNLAESMCTRITRIAFIKNEASKIKSK